VKVSFGIYKIVGVQEEKCRGAGRNCRRRIGLGPKVSWARF